MRTELRRLWFVALSVVAACGDAGPGVEPDGGPPPVDAAPPPTVSFRVPTTGASALGSVVVDLDADLRIEGAEVTVRGEPGPRCQFTAPPFVCLVDLSATATGPVTLTARGLIAGAEVAAAEVAVDHRGFATTACASGNPTDCVAALVVAGQAAGYGGLAYHDMDNGHAVAGTGGMTGLETKINQAYVGTDPWHSDAARIVIANQSQAYNFADGWMSMPRNGNLTQITNLWEQSKLFVWPEHRDHGRQDYYAWQTPALVLSQGSSGSELDEVLKLLHILAAMPSAVRTTLHQERLLMPTLAMLHRRARVTTDLDYLTPAPHASALADADVARDGIALAASLRAGELPPLVGLTLEQTSIPPAWAALGFRQIESSKVAMTWSATTAPATAPGEQWRAIVDLAPASRDLGGRRLYFFARVMRGDPAHVTVTQLDGSRFEIAADWPAEHTARVNGHDRGSRRATIGFVAHNGLWMSAPAFVSVFGGAPAAHAPDSNDLD